MADRIEMRDGTDHQNSHGLIKEIERVIRIVEEEDISQPQNQPRNRQRHDSKKLKSHPTGLESPALLHQISPEEHDHCAEQSSIQCHADGIEIGIPAATIHQVKAVIVERQFEVIRPELHQSRILRHAQHANDQQGDDGAEHQHHHVDTAIRFWLQRNRACG